MKLLLSLRFILSAFVLATPLVATAATFSTIPSADAFVSNGPGGRSGSNYGGGGGVSVSAPGLSQGELQSVLRFGTAAAVSHFNDTFGAGQWTIESVTLQLSATPANNAIFNTPAAGLLAISWMQNDAWSEGSGTPAAPSTSGITFTSLESDFIAAGDESLGTFGFSGATSGAFAYALGLTPGLTADVRAGGDVSLRLFGADTTVSGVFNSRSNANAANRPVLTIVAVPEPIGLCIGALGLLLLARRRRSRRSP